MAGAGIQSLAKFRAQMCAGDCGNPHHLERGLPRILKNNRRADCHRQKYEFESRLPQAGLDPGNLSAELGNLQST
jgi:hypothetical protein